MSEVILEVRERAAVLIVGVMLIIVGVVLCGASLVSEESDGTMLSAGIAGLLAFVALGVYLILAFVNHRLKVFADGRMLYSASLGAKTEFCYADIAKIEQKMINGMLSLSFYDASGKRFGKVEDNMKDYEKLCQWLNTQKKKEEDAKAMGVQNGHEAEVTPVNGNSMGKAVRILYIVLGIIFLGLGVSCLFMLPGGGSVRFGICRCGMV